METTQEFLLPAEPESSKPTEGDNYADAREAARARTVAKPAPIVEVKADLLPTRFDKTGDEADKDKGIDLKDAARALSDMRRRRAEQAQEFKTEAETAKADANANRAFDTRN